jgi:hypothetical protein
MILSLIATISSITLMGIFAWKNHKDGWVKHRERLIDLPEVHRERRDNVSVVAEDAGALVGGTVITATEFSHQLASLQSSIRRANAPVIPPAPLSAEANVTDQECGTAVQ